MKIKYDLIQDILIYFLLMIAFALAISTFNHFYFADYYSLESQYLLVNENGLNIIDDNGVNINQQVNSQYILQNSIFKQVRRFEFIIFIISVILGFMLIMYSITSKLKLITQTLDQGINNLEQLQSIDNINKYQEINQINNKLNTAISSIVHKDTIRSNLYANMIHDFSTPLHILQGNLELMNNGIDIDINVLNSQLTRLDYLVKMNVAKQQYSYQQLLATDLEHYIEILAQLYPRCRFKTEIVSTLQLSTAVENFYRIIDNIVNNAIKHGKANIIKIELKAEDGNYLLTISNNGEPICDEIISQLFERNTSTASSGIGLDIVKQIINDLDYQISVNSIDNNTQFIITMPFHPTDLED